jgi:LacI family transcriptional regulator
MVPSSARRTAASVGRRVVMALPMALGHYRDIARGFQRFSVTGEQWTISTAVPGPAALALWQRWPPAGVMACAGLRLPAKRLVETGLAVVGVNCPSEGCEFPTVDVDHAAVGRLAAEHFLERGFESFGFVGSDASAAARLRFEGFRSVLDPRGFEPSRCATAFGPGEMESQRRQLEAELADWLGTLTLPAAVFAQDDAVARAVADAARGLGLRVPEELAILGVDNDELECSLANPAISSILLPGEQIGFWAGQLLQRRLRNPDRPAKQDAISLPPVGVVTRRSTDVVAVDDQETSAALRFIRRHATDGIRVNDVLEAVPVARRTLEKRFHALLGRGPFEEIRRVQIAEVKRLLAQGRYNVAEIAVRCGFESSQTLAVAFRKETAMTCSEFRQQCRPAVDRDLAGDEDALTVGRSFGVESA